MGKKYYYFYKITNVLNQRYYYGVHSTNNLNDGYLGSGKAMLKAIKKYGKENFKKEILKYFDTQEDMYNYEEAFLTKDILLDENCYNIQKGGRHGEKLNSITVRYANDPEGKCFNVSTDDPRYLSGELVHNLKGFITVRYANDHEGKYFNVSPDDPRYLSGELVRPMKDKVVVISETGVKFAVNKDDPRYLSGELKPYDKGYVTVRYANDPNGKCFHVKIDDPRYLSGELVHNLKGRPLPNDVKEKMKAGRQRAIKNGHRLGTWDYKWMSKTDLQISKLIKNSDINEHLKAGWVIGRFFYRKK